MKNVVIVGTGGFAAEVVEYIHDNQVHQDNFKYTIKGFLDINNHKHIHYKFDYPLLGNEQDYIIEKDDVFVLAIGELNLMKTKMNIVETLKSKGAEFINLVHHTVRLPDSTILGEGNIIAPLSIIGPKVCIGNFNIINYQSSIAHDCKVENFNIFSPSTIITGWVTIGTLNFFGTSVSVIPSVSIGNGNKIQSGVTIEKNIKDSSFVFSTSKVKQMILGNI